MTDSWAFEAIGTVWQIDTSGSLVDADRAAVTGLIDRFDRTWSRFRSDSVVAQLAASAGTYEFEHADRLLTFYDDLHRVTAGAVNPLVGRRLADLGYDAGYSLVASHQLAAVPDWRVIERHENVVTARQPVLLDVGAAGKGLLVDLVVDLLREAGHDAVTVDAGGDLLHRGAPPSRVALEHPFDPTRAIGVLTLDPGLALCGSAVNRRAWGAGLHHVLDARSGDPSRDVLATWVIGPSAMVADGLATAHFFAAPDVLTSLAPHEFVRVHADGSIVRSEGLPGEVFS